MATDVNKRIVIIPTVGYRDLTENGSAEGAMDSHKNREVVSGALIYEGRRYSGPLHPYRLSANMTTEAASKAATMITYGLRLRSFSRGIGRARVLAHLKVWWVWQVTGMPTSQIYRYNGRWCWRWQLQWWWWAASGSSSERHTEQNAEPPYQRPTKWLPRSQQIIHRSCLPRWPEMSTKNPLKPKNDMSADEVKAKPHSVSNHREISITIPIQDYIATEPRWQLTIDIYI